MRPPHGSAYALLQTPSIWLRDLFTFTLVPSLLFPHVVACFGAKEAQADHTRHQRHAPLWCRVRTRRVHTRDCHHEVTWQAQLCSDLARQGLDFVSNAP